MSSEKPPAAPQKPNRATPRAISAAEIVVKVLLALVIGAVVLTALVFGTCVLLMRH